MISARVDRDAGGTPKGERLRAAALLLAFDEATGDALVSALHAVGIEGRVAPDLPVASLAAKARHETACFRALVLDLDRAGEPGFAFLAAVRRRTPEVPILVLTAPGSVTTAVAAARLGACEVIEKPAQPDAMAQMVARAARQDFEHASASAVESAELLGDSAAMDAVRERLEQAASHREATVLIEGETGVGKELAARFLHSRARFDARVRPHADAPALPFVAVNCASLSETLLEAELFGHDRGAFTGALQDGRPGLFEVAASGTILLDEVGELSLPLQAKLLRVLEERSVRRVGGRDIVPVTARVVAATNRSLERAIAAGQFRRDLYYRLAVVTIRIPPLRARVEDIVPLARHFLDRLGSLRVPPVGEFTRDALETLERHSWPGNVRELRNALHRAVLFGRGGSIRACDLEIGGDGSESRTEDASPSAASPCSLRSLEADHVRAALAETGGNVTRAATMLGIHRSTLYQKIREHRIDLVRRSPITDDHGVALDGAIRR